MSFWYFLFSDFFFPFSSILLTCRLLFFALLMLSLEQPLHPYLLLSLEKQGFPGDAVCVCVCVCVSRLNCQCSRWKRCGFDPWVGKIPWRRAWQPIPVFFPGESHGQRSLVGYTVHEVAKSQIWLSELSIIYPGQVRTTKVCHCFRPAFIRAFPPLKISVWLKRTWELTRKKTEVREHIK